MSHQPNKEPLPMRRAKDAIGAYTSAGEQTDLLGSYTGVVRSEAPGSVSGAVLPPRTSQKSTDQLPGAGQHPVAGGKTYRRAMQSPSPDMPVQDADDL